MTQVIASVRLLCRQGLPIQVVSAALPYARAKKYSNEELSSVVLREHGAPLYLPHPILSQHFRSLKGRTTFVSMRRMPHMQVSIQALTELAERNMQNCHPKT